MPRMTSADLAAYEARRAPKMVASVSKGVEKEAELHAQIKSECNRRGWIPLTGSMAHRAYRTVGEPDFTIIADLGRVFFIEAKTKTGKLSVEQQSLKIMAAKLGHKIHTVRNITEFLEAVYGQ